MPEQFPNNNARTQDVKAEGADLTSLFGDAFLFPRILLQGEDGEMKMTGVGALYDEFRAPQVHLENLSRMVTRPEQFGVQKIQACIDYLNDGGIIQPNLPGIVRSFRRCFSEEIRGTAWEAGYEIRLSVVIYNSAVVKSAHVQRNSVIAPDNLEITTDTLNSMPSTGVSIRNLSEASNLALEGPVYAGQPLFSRVLRLLPGRTVRLPAQVLDGRTLELCWPDSLYSRQSPYLGTSRALYKMTAARSVSDFELRPFIMPLRYAPRGSCALICPDDGLRSKEKVYSPSADDGGRGLTWLRAGTERIITIQRGSLAGDDSWISSPDPAEAELRVAWRGRCLSIKNEGPALMHLRLSGLERRPFRGR